MAVNRRKDRKNRVLKEGERQRENGSYEYRWRDQSGKRHSIYAKTLEELRQKEKDVQKNSLTGIRKEDCQLTVNDLYELWKQVKRGIKTNTFSNYQYMYTQFVCELLGTRKVVKLRKTDIRSFYDHLLEEQHIKINTIDNVHTVLHQILNLAVDDELIRINPADSALKELKRAHNRDRGKKKALTLQEQEIFEQFLNKNGPYHRWYPIFIVMLWTGMRVGEATGLRWCDVDFDNNIIDINHTLVYYKKIGASGCTYQINTTKTDAGTRVIPMLPLVKEALLMEREYQRECEIVSRDTVLTEDGKAYTDFIFINRFGGVQNQGTLNKALRRIIRDCNFAILDSSKEDNPVLLPKFSNHTLRHTFTTRMCEAGVNIKAMQDILGHADAETTLQIYADATNELKKREMSNFAEFFKVKKPEIGK